MKCRAILLILMISYLHISCIDDKSMELSLKTRLIEKLLDNSEIKPSKGKLIVLKTEFCSGIDCEEYFKDYTNDILFLTRADIFMRGITDYVTIENLDEENGVAVLRKRNGNGFEKIEIKI